LAEAEVRIAHRTPLWRKLWAIVASGGLAVVTGAVLAIVLSFGVAWTVTTLTDMLGR
jgi:hypothetical protein